MSSYIKDPQAQLDYAWDWTSWLTTGETITSFVVAAGAGITQPLAATLVGAKVTAWLSGGTDGATYPVTCSITTSAGRSDDRTIRVRVLQR